MASPMPDCLLHWLAELRFEEIPDLPMLPKSFRSRPVDFRSKPPESRSRPPSAHKALLRTVTYESKEELFLGGSISVGLNGGGELEASPAKLRVRTTSSSESPSPSGRPCRTSLPSLSHDEQGFSSKDLPSRTSLHAPLATSESCSTAATEALGEQAAESEFLFYKRDDTAAMSSSGASDDSAVHSLGESSPRRTPSSPCEKKSDGDSLDSACGNSPSRRRPSDEERLAEELREGLTLGEDLAHLPEDRSIKMHRSMDLIDLSEEPRRREAKMRTRSREKRGAQPLRIPVPPPVPKMPTYKEAKDGVRALLTTTSLLYGQLREGGGQASCLDAITDFVALVEGTGFALHLPRDQLSALKEGILDLQREEDAAFFADYVRFLRPFVDRTTYLFCDMLLHELRLGPRSHDLPGALGDLAAAALLGESASAHVLRRDGVRLILGLCASLRSSDVVAKCCLRCLAVLCGLPSGCSRLMSLGGLELVLALLSAPSHPGVSVEAAGVLTQITAPSHSFGLAGLAKRLSEVVERLLDLCDWSADPESFLLSVGSLGNLALHQSSVSGLLYRHNAPRRLADALQSPKAHSAYAKDQIATVLGRMAANGFEEALVGQGCVRALLGLLSTRDPRHPALARNLRYKAAICLGSLGGLGLKAMHEAGGIPVLQEVLNEGQELRRAGEGRELRSSEEGTKLRSSQDGKELRRSKDRSPTMVICESLLTNLMDKYTLVTAV